MSCNHWKYAVRHPICLRRQRQRQYTQLRQLKQLKQVGRLCPKSQLPSQKPQRRQLKAADQSQELKAPCRLLLGYCRVTCRNDLHSIGAGAGAAGKSSAITFEAGA